ncbi:MAG TPA: GNAT family N-acetyltransferase [Acidimicrobiia bacterium]|nr:GNAT family N-acetyltransferase [Acidimicrobiia bacterium]
MVGAQRPDPPPHHVLRWRGGWARLGAWRGSTEVAFVSVGAQRPPDGDLVERALRTLTAEGYTSVVTNALAPADALPFVDAGFAVRERLHLLAHDMVRLPYTTLPTRRARRADRELVLALDGRAFDGFWRLDAQGLDDALHATPVTRFRVAEDGPDVVAYAISGRAGATGYLQRIAVDPSVRGRGWGRAVVTDALHWLHRHHVSRTLVNTQCDNDAALHLYEACGFARLPVGLCVMGREL